LTAGMYVSQRWKFWTCNVTVRVTGTSCYISVKYHLMWLLFSRKIYEFPIKLFYTHR